MPDNSPTTRRDLQEVSTRNDTARQIVAGFSDALPTLARYWQTIDTALSDITELVGTLKRIRLDHANLLAAARATLSAYADGEADHLAYLRDELDDQAEGRADR
ncbi:hypothetical protein GCM10029978_002070 [Actinoallomurus acanthiterrae]